MRIHLVLLAAAVGIGSPQAMFAEDAPVVITAPPVPPADVPAQAAPTMSLRPRTPEGLVNKSVQDLSRGALGAAVKDDVKALQRGPLLMHGNYCGIGNRPGKAPVDALDAACMRHDACTQTGKLPSCACDDRLRIEATDIAKDQSTPPDIKAVASATAAAMSVLMCKTSPGAATVVVPALEK